MASVYRQSCKGVVDIQFGGGYPLLIVTRLSDFF